MKLIVLLPALALAAALAACSPKPAPANAAVAAASAADAGAAINGPTDCAADGLKPGTEAYNDCVSALADTNAVDPNAMRAQMQADAAQQRAQMQQDMAQDRASMQQQMNQAEQNPGAGGSGCKTTTDANNNVSTVCP